MSDDSFWSKNEVLVYGCFPVDGTGTDPDSQWYKDYIRPVKRNPIWAIRVDQNGNILPPPMPEVKIKLLPGAQVPTKAHSTDAGYDLYLYEDIELPPGKVVFARTGIKIHIPPGYEGQIRPRSGLSTKQKIIVINSPGTIDSNFSNEVLVALMNINQDDIGESLISNFHEHIPAETIILQKGQRIAQIIFNAVETARFLVVDELEETERGEGGFGSSGI